MTTDTAHTQPRWSISVVSDRTLPALIGLLLLGLGAGLSPFFFAYYDTSVWVPVGLGLTVLCAIGVVARPMRLTGPAILAATGVLGLGIWSLSSTAWAESVENAIVSGNRWLAYGALLLLVLVLARNDRRSAVLLSAAGLGVAAVAVSVLVRLLGGNPGALFLVGRLNSPLGYINGEGCLFVMGFWLCIAAAEARRALIAGPAACAATLMVCLALLSQSRGTALAMLGSLLIVVAFVPGRTRRLYGLLLVAAGVALAAPDLLHVYTDTQHGAISLRSYHVAANAAVLAALAVGILWGVLTACWEQLRSAGELAARLRAVGSGLLVLLSVIALVVAVASTHRIEREVRGQWHAFTHLATAGTSEGASSSVSQSRLLSGAGNRYDYWRIAWTVWRDNPVLGVGAGNYARPYYEQRATTEDIDQPHSIELQTLAELGLVGALLLAAMLAGVGWGTLRMRSAAASSPLSRALMVGAVGAFIAWLTQTSVDWMHLLPGLTAIAIAAVAVLVRGQNTDGRDRKRGFAQKLTSRPARALGLSAVLATLVVAGASLSRQGLADIYREDAQGELDAHPAAALTDANRSLNIDSDSSETYYLKAAALARFDQAAGAERVLGEALADEPANFVTWALLGDIAVREHSFSVARRDYVRAHQLNPRDVALSELASDPRGASQ
jgi:cytochrome bd-type quinol oxidase subunit 2